MGDSYIFDTLLLIGVIGLLVLFKGKKPDHFEARKVS